MNIFHGIILASLLVTNCTYDTNYIIENSDAGTGIIDENGNEVSMSAAKTATATIISKIDKVGPQIQDAFNSPTVYTVQFAVSGQRPYPNGLGVTGNINPVATILWSLGGNTIRRKISAFSGASITGVCEHVNVTVSDETSQADVSQQQEYQATIVAASGSRAGTFNPPTYQIYQLQTAGLTIRLGASLVAGGTSVDVTIPDNIGVVSLLSTALILNGGTPLADGDAIITQFNTIGGQLKQYSANIPLFVPVSPQATIVRMTNTTASDVLFSLTWGIDG